MYLVSWHRLIITINSKRIIKLVFDRYSLHQGLNQDRERLLIVNLISSQLILKTMHLQQKTIIVILFSISVIGVIGIQIGNPKFLTNAIVLESAFVALTALSFWRLRYVLIPNMIIT